MKDNESTELVKSVRNYVSQNMDDMLTTALLDVSLGQIIQQRSRSNNIRMFAICDYIISAIGERDMGMISSIIKRIDGGVPKSDERHAYANIMGNALDDVLDMPPDERADINFDEPAIIAMAKAIVLCSLDKPGKNISRKKDRQLAVDIILSRTGGAKIDPVKNIDNVQVVEPDWAKLPSK